MQPLTQEAHSPQGWGGCQRCLKCSLGLWIQTKTPEGPQELARQRSSRGKVTMCAGWFREPYVTSLPFVAAAQNGSRSPELDRWIPNAPDTTPGSLESVLKVMRLPFRQQNDKAFTHRFQAFNSHEAEQGREWRKMSSQNGQCSQLFSKPIPSLARH